MIGISVYGVPAPQGSKRHVGRGVMVESSKAVKPWRLGVQWAAVDAMGGLPPMVGPLAVDVVFYLPRPKSAKRGAWPFKRPDADKLLRSTFDGLGEGGVWLDDAQVVRIHAEKVYADPDCVDGPVLPGASITITQVT